MTDRLHTNSHSRPERGATASQGSRADASLAYRSKTARYFTAPRCSFIDPLPANPTARLLELGCGTGATGAYALQQGKCGWCCGIELCEGPAAEARKSLNQVIVGDIEEMTIDLLPASFDVLLVSHVLEHLRNPKSVLTKLHVLLRSGALVVSASPNVCHHTMVRMLLRGRFDYQREGVMDETHLRWFSPATFRCLFEEAGYIVDHVGSASPMGTRARLLNRLSLRHFEYLFHPEIELRAHCA
jgi:2-polyprenyl-3-methyl-5-hydroxy-6-metoxy-1,4-benzoquinol methylase